MKTKAAVAYEVGKSAVVEELELRPPRENEVLIKIRASGVCHSDLSLINGTIVHPLPEVLGHEGAGTVVEVGKGVTEYKPGDPVMLSFVLCCGKCEQCQSGHHTLCEIHFETHRGRLLDDTCRFHKNGLEINQFSRLGTMSEYTVVPIDTVVPMPDGSSLRTAALIGCGVSTGIGAVTRAANVQAGESVCIIGTGGVGLNAVQGARLVGAEPIIAIDRLENKLQAAMEFGATHTINSTEVDPVEAVKELTSGKGVHYAIEVIGYTPTMEMAFNMLRHGGNAVIVGIAGQDQKVQIPAWMLPYGERKISGTFMGSCNPREDMPHFLRLYEEKRLKLDELVTRSYDLEEVNEAFADLEAGKNIRGIIDFGD